MVSGWATAMLGAELGNPTPSPSLGAARQLAPVQRLQTLLSSCRHKYFQAPNLLLLIHPLQQNNRLSEVPEGLFVVGVARRGVWVSPQFSSSPSNRAGYVGAACAMRPSCPALLRILSRARGTSCTQCYSCPQLLGLVLGGRWTWHWATQSAGDTCGWQGDTGPNASSVLPSLHPQQQQWRCSA